VQWEAEAREDGVSLWEPLVAKSPDLGLIPTWLPSMGGALAPLILSSSCAHLRIWEVGWENVLWIFAVLVSCVSSYMAGRGSLGGHPLVCTADPWLGSL
jgi:hypothetical protein